jgi:hypothetical protein
MNTGPESHLPSLCPESQDPETLCEILAILPSQIASAQADAESAKATRDELKRRRDLAEARAYLDAGGTVEERRRLAMLDDGVEKLDNAVGAAERDYREKVVLVESLDRTFVATRKILTWRMQELSSLAEPTAMSAPRGPVATPSRRPLAI